MACRGVHFALTDDDRAKLIALVEAQGDVVAFIQEEVEERWDREWLCETDKAWDAIHRCLTDGTLSYDDETPLHWCILGGSQMHVGDDYIASFVDGPDVALVADALDAITQTDFRSKYNAIDPGDYGMPLSDEDFEYTWEYFTELRKLFRKAANENRSVVFTVDQ